MTIPAALPHKIELLITRLNISRAKLAQKIGVDKSLVSRWASGRSVPSEHNMVRVTQAISDLLPGFGRADWELDEAAFRSRLGLPEREEVVSSSSTALSMRSFAASRRDIEREAPIYEGMYLSYNRSSINNGNITRRAIKFWREAHRLQFLSVGASRLYDVRGEAFVLRGKLFCLGEMERYDGVSLSILNGTTRTTPDLLTGIAAGVGTDAVASPNATLIVLEFKSRFTGHGERDDSAWAALTALTGEFPTNGKFAKAIGRRIKKLIDARVSGTATSGERDWLLRAPVVRSPKG